MYSLQVQGIYVRRMTKNINNHAMNTATMDPRISHVIPLEVLLYICNLPPVETILSAFLDNIVDAFSINFCQRCFQSDTFESSLNASPKAILRSLRPLAMPNIAVDMSSCNILWCCKTCSVEVSVTSSLSSSRFVKSLFRNTESDSFESRIWVCGAESSSGSAASLSCWTWLTRVCKSNIRFRCCDIVALRLWVSIVRVLRDWFSLSFGSFKLYYQLSRHVDVLLLIVLRGTYGRGFTEVDVVEARELVFIAKRWFQTGQESGKGYRKCWRRCHRGKVGPLGGARSCKRSRVTG